MHRIDTPTAQKDKFGAGKNGFTRGNPQTGTPATDLDDDYFDMLQEELAGVVEATGVNLDKSKHNQLLTALKALLLSRAHPFADIKADGTAAIAEALSNLGLTAITTVKGTADSFPYFSGPNSARLTTLTDFARNLLSKPDDIDARTALGLGSAATKAVGNGSGQLPDMSFFGRSSDNAGYFLLPSGIVVQWGRVAISGSTTAHITYPIPFPSKMYVLTASPVGSGFTINPATPVFTEGDKTGCDVSSWGTSNYTALYIAIGG